MKINLLHPSNIGSKYQKIDLYRTTERKFNNFLWLPGGMILIPFAIIVFAPLAINLISGFVSGQKFEPSTWFLPYNMM